MISAPASVVPDIELVLSYPRSWSCRRNPGAARAEADVGRWLEDRGVIDGSSDRELFRKLGVADYVGWPFPEATSPRFEVIARFLTLWIFYDDRIEEEDDGLLQVLHQALSGRGVDERLDSPHVRAWAELGRACAAEMSPEWCERHADRFVAWAASVREESAIAAGFRRTGVLPSSADHLEARIQNIGMIPNLDLLEYQRGYELSREVLEAPILRDVERSSAAVVAILNDLHARDKDRAAGWCNLVSCFEAEGRGVEGAFRGSVALHDHYVLELVAAERALLAQFPEEPALRVWIRDVNQVVYGFARFHNRVPRYRNTFPVESGATLRLVVDAAG